MKTPIVMPHTCKLSIEVIVLYLFQLETQISSFIARVVLREVNAIKAWWYACSYQDQLACVRNQSSRRTSLLPKQTLHYSRKIPEWTCDTAPTGATLRAFSLFQMYLVAYIKSASAYPVAL